MQINRYDAEGLRHELEENGRLVQFIFNDSREVIAEQDENKWTLYIRASSLLASSTDHARTYYHYASDEMGSTTHIVDSEGAVQNRYAYDAWGNVTEQTETIPNRFKFNGQQLDPITQQYYLRARFYNPVIARFTQEDTYRGDGLNLYAYCANNPVVYEDPTGHICETAAVRLQARRDAGDQLTRRERRDLGAYERVIAMASGQSFVNPDDFSHIRAYNGVNVNSIPEQYRADPRLTINMDYVGTGTASNAAGWERNASQHFSQLLAANQDFWSSENIARINNNHAPMVDSTFARFFPQYSGAMGDKLISHHIGGGGQVTAVPSSYHSGFGGIHNIENALGVRGNDGLTGVAQLF